MTLYPYEHDTPEMAALVVEYDRLEEQQQFCLRRQRTICEQIDETRQGLRPTYPTDQHRVEAGETSPTHHGEPITVGVACDPGRRWLHLGHRAPHTARGGGGYLWGFTDEEVEALLELFRDSGHEIGSHWRSDGGLSVVLEPKS
jgi:hypothetical protein